MSRFYAPALAILLVVIAVGSTWWYVDSLQADVAAARRDLATAQSATSSCATALTLANDATAKAEQKAALMQSQAQTLIDSAASDKAKNNADGAAFAEKVTHSAKAPDCQAVLEAQLCPALSGY
ncbi:hypothetical protein [Luteibacter yeojuensis]|uniref:Uncharacterized protein n=1 Tax=Luteibacter yeojuensis TaxID=345309 RepID=A0A7X5QU02_9GAMM|nr:hypothetical protein [Luteibacter yeojuensis]NID15397.1 hypothetical protein [Luteibacter yeojuensis]